jgi:hypothetical protein
MATNLGGSMGQPQSAVTTIGNMQAGAMPCHLPQQQQTVGTSIDTPMEVESAVQSVGESHVISPDVN